VTSPTTLLAATALALALGSASCGGTNAGGVPQDDDTWLLMANGASVAVPLTPEAPAVTFTVRATTTYAGEPAALEGALSLTLAQPADLATYTVDWPLRNEFCHVEDPAGFCERFVKWQEVLPADGSCADGACVITMSVTVSAVDAASLPADLTGLTLTASGYLRGPVEDPQGSDPAPPPGTSFVLEVLPGQ
jgi:hypothetical protein